MRNFIYVFLFCAVLLSSCVEYHPYDTHIAGQTNVNAKNIALIEEQCMGKREVKFAVVSDSQRWYDELEDAVESINERDDIDFVLHTGDLADWGLRSEFEIQRDILNSLNVPYVCLLGNHDCLGTGYEIFREVFGECNVAFSAGNVRFVCLNTNSLEFTAAEAVPNFGFIRAEYSNLPVQSEKTVVAMHSYPYSDQFNNDVAPMFQEYLRKFPNLQFCVHGHGHRYRREDIFGDGVYYYECPNVGSDAYLVFTINDVGYEYKKVDL